MDIRGTGVLTSDLQSPVVSQTSVRPDLLKPLEIGSHLLVDNVGKKVARLSGGDVSLPVEEPFGDLELSGVLHDGNDSLELIRVELSGTEYQYVS
jgi:hypothetical protein